MEIMISAPQQAVEELLVNLAAGLQGDARAELQGPYPMAAGFYSYLAATDDQWRDHQPARIMGIHVVEGTRLSFEKFGFPYDNLFHRVVDNLLEYAIRRGYPVGVPKPAAQDRPSRPTQRPRKRTKYAKVDLYWWMAYYHAMRSDGQNYTFKDLATELDGLYTEGYLKKVHRRVCPVCGAKRSPEVTWASP